MASPRLEIDLEKIAHNIHILTQHYASRGISVIGVCKAVCGHPEIASVLLNSGIQLLGDSRIKNIKRMKKAGITAPFVLIRTPLQSELKEVIEHCMISHNTEYSVIEALSKLSLQRNSVHQIILMVELGDLREGILITDLESVIHKIKKLKGIKIVGLGTNLACFCGVEPNDKNMSQLSKLATAAEYQLGYKLTYLSGGNSANYTWSVTTRKAHRINYLRLGESIYLGCDPLNRKPIPGLYTDAFSLVTEVIESGSKPSVPTGTQHQNAFATQSEFKNNGQIFRAILGVGLQDVAVSGLNPRSNIEILGASSDHLIVDTKNKKLKIGEELKFDLNYAALLAVMTSPYVTKKTLKFYELD